MAENDGFTPDDGFVADGFVADKSNKPPGGYGVLNDIGTGVKDALAGVGSGVISTGVGAYNLARKLPGIGDALPAPNEYVQGLTKPPDSIPGQIGHYAEQAAEYALPGGAAKGAGLLRRALVNGMEAAGVAGLQSGGNPASMATAGVLGGAGTAIPEAYQIGKKVASDPAARDAVIEMLPKGKEILKARGILRGEPVKSPGTARGRDAANRIIRGQQGGKLANPGPYEPAPAEGAMPNMEAINPEYIPPTPTVGGDRAAELARQQISRQNGPTVDISRSRNPEVGVSNKGPQGLLERGPRAPLSAPPSTMPDMGPSRLSTVAPEALTAEQRIARAKAQPEPAAVTPTPEVTPEVTPPATAPGPLEGNAKAMEAARALQEEMQQSGSAPPPSQEGLSIPRESYESENRHLKTAAVDALLKKHGISWEDAQKYFSDQDWLNVFAEAKQNAPGFYSGNPAISKGQTLIKGGAPINKLRPKARGGVVAPQNTIPNMEKR